MELFPEKICTLGLGVVAFICNYSYLGEEIGRILVWGQPRQKLVRPPSQPVILAWWCACVITDTQAVGFQSEAGREQNHETLSLK
jgi:hypothetical protein